MSGDHLRAKMTNLLKQRQNESRVHKVNFLEAMTIVKLSGPSHGPLEGPRTAKFYLLTE
jgi:hypothetical protein